MDSFYRPKYQNKQQPKLTAFSFFTETITPREIQVLDLLAKGSLTKDIAAQLQISKATVSTHLKNIYRKTGAQNKIEALNKTRWLTVSLQSNQY